MTDLRKAAEMALEALETLPAGSSYKTHNAASALRQALEQPEQEPVAWMYVNRDGECEQIEFGTAFDDPSVTLLYTAPPKREWQGLTGDEVNDLKHWLDHRAQWSYIEFARAIEAKLKEKNRG